MGVLLVRAFASAIRIPETETNEPRWSGQVAGTRALLAKLKNPRRQEHVGNRERKFQQRCPPFRQPKLDPPGDRNDQQDGVPRSQFRGCGRASLLNVASRHVLVIAFRDEFDEQSLKLFHHALA